MPTDSAPRDPGVHTFGTNTTNPPKQYERTGINQSFGDMVAADPSYKAVDLLELFDAHNCYIQAQCQDNYEESNDPRHVDDLEMNPDEIWVKVLDYNRLEIITIWQEDGDFDSKLIRYSGNYMFSLMSADEVQAMNDYAADTPNRIRRAQEAAQETQAIQWQTELERLEKSPTTPTVEPEPLGFWDKVRRALGGE